MPSQSAQVPTTLEEAPITLQSQEEGADRHQGLGFRDLILPTR